MEGCGLEWNLFALVSETSSESSFMIMNALVT